MIKGQRLFTLNNITVSIYKDQIYINNKLTDKLTPARMEGKLIGVFREPARELITFKSFPNWTYDTQLINSIKIDKQFNRVSPLRESKKFIPVHRVTEE